jgi:hypothetical protein
LENLTKPGILNGVFGHDKKVAIGGQERKAVNSLPDLLHDSGDETGSEIKAS